ncbi:MAG: DUF6642 family protein [bacterium]
MRFAKYYQKYVFCLEGNWHSDMRNRASIRSVLEFLSVNCNLHYIHRNCGTREELTYYLQQWPYKRYERYAIGYLAFHGQPGALEINKKTCLVLEELGELLAGKCAGRILHFGSCNLLDVSPRRIRTFVQRTGCLCVCGYRQPVDWISSSAFDMLLIDMFQYYRDVDALAKRMQGSYGSLISALHFRIIRP